LPFTIASALCLDVSGSDLETRLAEVFGTKRVLLVLDNAHQAPEAVADLIDVLLHSNRAASIVAISREPLGAKDECVYRVSALDPCAETRGHPMPTLQSAGVRLFIERARSADSSFSVDEQTACVIASICARLGGIPLAIEIAAARAPVLGVEEVTTQLDEHMGRGSDNREALPPNEIVRATLDWSYGLLSEEERAVLKRLAGFAGPFSVEDAAAVAQCQEMDDLRVCTCIEALISASLVTPTLADRTTQYRLPDRVRAHALATLFTESRAAQQRAFRALLD
jgi:predicted ATPase